MERDSYKGFTRKVGVGRFFEALGELRDKPAPGHVKLRNIMKDHGVVNSMDLPRSVRTAFATEILEHYRERRGHVYDGGDFFTLDTYFAITGKLGRDAFVDCYRNGLISQSFLTPKSGFTIEDVLRHYEESAIKEGWKQDKVSQPVK